MFFMQVKKLNPDETEIIGAWNSVDGKVEADKNCERIDRLITGHLVKKAISKECGGWETLYQDPSDLRFWELNYPKSNWHGGGPPALIHLSNEEARSKYNFESVDGDPWMQES